MLPNWLLGKSKSKLIEELGGGGGGTSYTAGDGIDISSGVISFDPSTTPVIDPSKIYGLDDDLEALAPKTAISNPNILHNPWFTVNQRSALSVTANGLFIADRWLCYSPVSFEITRNADGNIVIDNTSIANYSAIIQKRTTTYINSLNGAKLTASIMLSDGTIKSGTITFDSSGNTQKYYEDDDIVAYVLPSANQLFGLNVKAGKSITIKALKVEVGEISTLHLDPRPEYATELAKCQRYFIRIFNEQTDAALLGSGVAKNTQSITIVFPYPSGMRTKSPAITSSQDAIIYSISDSASGALAVSISGSYCTSHSRAVNINANGLTTSVAYNIYLKPAAYIDFSAEL
ncbi:MAG: hypothetical protein IKS59_06185 [Aeriscardovia sp.]|nr:hypothetical protein [Aeriscardovia sp.]